MKYTRLLIIVLLLAGCQYEDPITEEHKIPIDPAVLGVWQNIPDKGNPDPSDFMVVLKYSDTEYLIVISPGKKEGGGIYLRGYPIKIGGILCVQIKVIGIWGGPVDKHEKRLFDVALYQLENNELTIKTLNADLVNKKLKGNDLEKAFFKNRDDKNLFIVRDELKFRKQEKKGRHE